MGKIQDLIKRLSAATEIAQEDMILRILVDNKTFILDLETTRLFLGRNSEGGQLMPPYKSPEYAAFKLSMNSNGVVDLKLTGDFWRGFFMTADKFPVTFDSTDPKTPLLTEKYDHIFGIDPTSAAILKREIIGAVREYYRTQVYQV